MTSVTPEESKVSLTISGFVSDPFPGEGMVLNFSGSHFN